MRAILITLSLMTAAAGCASGLGPHDASADVRALVMALRDRDPGGIEARIDRQALERQATGVARIMAADEIARRAGGGGAGQVLGVLGADMASPIIERLVRRALEPDILADVARRAGLTPDARVPGRMTTAIALKRVDDTRVCAPDPTTQRCLLYFGKYPSGWKLNGIDETTLRAKISPQPAPRPAARR